MVLGNSKLHHSDNFKLSFSVTLLGNGIQAWIKNSESKKEEQNDTISVSFMEFVKYSLLQPQIRSQVWKWF